MNIHLRCGKGECVCSWCELAGNRQEGFGGLMDYVYVWDNLCLSVKHAWVLQCVCMFMYVLAHKSILCLNHILSNLHLFVGICIYAQSWHSHIYLCVAVCLCVWANTIVSFPFSIWKRFPLPHFTKTLIPPRNPYSCMCMCICTCVRTHTKFLCHSEDDSRQ